MSTAKPGRTKIIVIVILALLANYGLDRATKTIAVEELKGQGSHSFFGGLMVISYAENTGAFLSMGNAWPIPIKITLLLVLPIAVCLLGLYYALFREPSLAKAAVMATVIAGGLANLQDRLFNNFRVVDFLNFGIGNLRTGILNVADLSVTFGVIVWMILELKSGKKPEEKKGA